MSTIIELDKTILATYYDNHKEDIAMMLGDYLEKYDNIISSLQEAKNANIQQLRETLHYHSSVFAYIGLPTLTEEFKQLEQKCINNEPLGNDFDVLLQKVQQTKAIVEKEYLFYSS